MTVSPARIRQIAVPVDSIEEAKAFYGGTLGLRHLFVGLVFDRDRLPAFALVANDSHEEADGAIRGTGRREERGEVDGLAGQVHQPPATGGR